jgi:hypothetical protein
MSWSSYGTEWLYLLVPLIAGPAVAAYLLATGGPGGGFDRLVRSIERVTGLPAWCGGGLLMGFWALAVAVLGFYWDVAWHIELGRDEFILTPAHMAILLGLMLIVGAAAAAILLATHARANVGFEALGMRVPYAAVPLGLLGAGALCGFPLDEFWHQAYGIDVTMWGPTHLVMISGASLSPIALLFLLKEAGPARPTSWGRALAALIAPAVVVGLSTWTGEFDFGVPQFQALYHPVLVTAGCAAAFVGVRVAFGAGAALRAAAGAIALRAVLALVLGAGLGLVIPRWPLYLGSALVVEAAFRVVRNRSLAVSATAAGAAVGSVGLLSEWVWMSLWGRNPWTLAFFPEVLLAAAVALPAAAIGAAFGSTGSPEGLPRRAVAVSGVVLIAALAIPLPRNGAPVDATIVTERVGERAAVEVTLDPPDAATEAEWFEILSWQGGAMETQELVPTSPGTYQTPAPVPVTGEWKTILRFADGDTLIGAPLYMPADPEIGASEVPLEPRRKVSLMRDTTFLMREAVEGPAWPGIVAYSAIGVLAVAWIVSLGRSSGSIDRRTGHRRAAGTHMTHRPAA